MTITVINVITVLVGVIFFLRTVEISRRRQGDFELLIVSSAVGFGLIGVGLKPDIFEYIGAIIGLEWKARAILVTANLTLFGIVIFLIDWIGRLNDNITTLNEEVSLLKAEIRKNNDDAE